MREPMRLVAVCAGSPRTEAWSDGSDIWLRRQGSEPMVRDARNGDPMGLRWECSVAHWDRYRESVFGAFKDPAVFA